MVIVDTTVWIDYLGGTASMQASWLDREAGRQRLGLTDLILCEILQGIRSDAAFANVRRTLENFQVFETGGADLAVAAAENYRRLRQRGFTVRKTIDCLVATFCLETGHSLLHRDRDFDPFEQCLGLQVVRP
ncbi:MAG: PIN domain nuclease [Candidatus Korobacteraceae bacterium]|jgi:predicted nucleic acid-binding protein